MFASKVCLLTASLLVVSAMPPPPAGEMTEAKSLCYSALVTTPRGPDLPIMTTCCSTDTQLTEGQCQEVLKAMSGGTSAMKKMKGGVMQEKESKPMGSGKTSESMPEPKPEPGTSVADKVETTTKGMEDKMEKKAGEKGMEMNSTESVEEDGEDDNTEDGEGEKMITMEMMAAEHKIMQCLMKTVGLISAEGVVNEPAARHAWNKRVVPTAGEEQKKKLVAAIDTCPLTSKQELLMFPMCLVKTCSAAAQ